MSKENKEAPLLELQVTSLSSKGNGIASYQRRQNANPIQIEIPFTVPGDVIRAKLIGRRGETFIGQLSEIVTPSPNRGQPQCSHFGECGGCRLQHVSYHYQTEHKASYVRQCFGDLVTETTDFRPLFKSDRPFRYRNKMEFTFSNDASGRKYLGLVKEGTKGRVLNLSECHLAEQWFTDVLLTVKKWWDSTTLSAYHMYHNTGTLRTLMMREGKRSGDRMIILTISGNPNYPFPPHLQESFVEKVRKVAEPKYSNCRLSIYLRILQVEKGMTTTSYDMLLYGPGYIRETLNIQLQKKGPVQLNFEIGPSSFFQPNPQQTEQFYSLALSLAEIPSNAIVYDLYCGSGALGLSISKHVKQVIGIEISPESALDAHRNAIRNGCNNVSIISGAVRHTINHLEPKIPMPDFVIINPPRAGLDPVAMQELLSLNAPKILYISCNPITQAANTAELVRNGYKLKIVQPVDQFPQTNHIENIIILTRDL